MAMASKIQRPGSLYIMQERIFLSNMATRTIKNYESGKKHQTIINSMNSFSSHLIQCGDIDRQMDKKKRKLEEQIKKAEYAKRKIIEED